MKTQQQIDDDRMKAAILFLVENYTTQPKLNEIASQVNMSSFHFQRMFQEWVGVTPKQFVQYLSVEHAKKMLKETHATLFDATCELGFSGTSRLHDLFVNIEGMTPGEYKNGGANLSINYTFADTPFGTVIVASTDKGICHMTFADEGHEGALERLKSSFPNAKYNHFLDMRQQNALFVFTQDWSKLQEIKLHLKKQECLLFQTTSNRLNHFIFNSPNKINAVEKHFPTALLLLIPQSLSNPDSVSTPNWHQR